MMPEPSEFSHCGQDVYGPVVSSIFTACICAAFGIVTIAGNLLVCLAVYLDPYNKLRSPFSYYILNLAFSDLIVGLIAEPISAVHHILKAMKIDDMEDNIMHISFLVPCTASVFSLSALCIDRYFAMTSPIIYRVTRHKVRALLATMIVWMSSGMLPPIAYRYLGFPKCSLVFANGAVILTFFILLFTCGRILQSRNTLKRSLNTASSCRYRASRMSATLIADCKAVENQMKEKKVTSMFAIMVAVYLVCYAPSVLMIYFLNYCSSCTCDTLHWLKNMQFLFVLLSSAVNPFLYCWRLPSYREALVHIMKSDCKKNNLNVRNPLKASERPWKQIYSGDTIDTSDSV